MSELKPVEEIDDAEIVNTALQVYARAVNPACSEELHNRAFALKAELERRINTRSTQHFVEQACAAIGGKRVYAPQGANFEQQARCEQINTGISMAIAALRDKFKEGE